MATKLNAGTATYSNFYPEIMLCVDHNDTAAPTSTELFYQQGKKVKTGILSCTKWIYYKLHQTCQQLIYSGLASGYSVPGKRNSYINFDNNGGPHYGLKYSIGMPGLGTVASDFCIKI